MTMLNSQVFNLSKAIEQDWPVLRGLALAPFAFLVTAFLIVGMERLIASDPIDIEPEPPYKVPNPVLVEPPPMDIVRGIPEKPEAPELEPEIPEFSEVPIDPPGGEVFMKGPSLLKKGKVGLAFNADAPIATMLMQPDYPTRAASKGIEGYVDVKFDVLPSGATANIVVVGAEPSSIFNRAALKAVKRWKFQPAEKSGKPILYQGMEHRIIFQMQSKEA